MGKRYYCEYCDCSFDNSVEVRKKHMHGTSHIRNRKMHYMQFRDLKTLIEEEEKKEECFKFLRSGQCHFMDNCYRSHFSKQQLQNFKQKLDLDNKFKIAQQIAELKTIDSWLASRGEFSSFPTMLPEIGQQTPFVSYFQQPLPYSLQSLHSKHLIDPEVPNWG